MIELAKKKKDDQTETNIENDIVEVAKATVFDLAELEGVGAIRKKRLEDAGISSPMDLVVIGPTEISEITGMDKDQAEKVCRTAREYLEKNDILRKSFQKASDTLKYRENKINSNRIDTGCKSLNELLGGGFEPQAVTEFYGIYGCGKTQICHTASVMAQLPKEQGGLNGEVIWIDTEGTFRPERIRDIVIERGLIPLKDKDKKSDPNEPVDEADVMKFLDRITVANATNASHQELIVDEIRSLMEVHNKDTKDGKISDSDPRPVLIIVDSLTTHFRVEYTGRGLLQPKQASLNKHIHKLLKTAEIYNVAVIITNQVIANPEGFGNPIKPVGGNVLAHASTYRVYLRKGTGVKRIAKMDDSPMHEQKEVVFGVEKSGVVDLDD
jgi:DNA repair protein RadA